MRICLCGICLNYYNDQCFQILIQKANFDQHVQTHIQVWKYSADYCSQTYIDDAVVKWFRASFLCLEISTQLAPELQCLLKVKQDLLAPELQCLLKVKQDLS